MKFFRIEHPAGVMDYPSEVLARLEELAFERGARAIAERRRLERSPLIWHPMGGWSGAARYCPEWLPLPPDAIRYNRRIRFWWTEEGWARAKQEFLAHMHRQTDWPFWRVRSLSGVRRSRIAYLDRWQAAILREGRGHD